jgi:hypothetical protein
LAWRMFPARGQSLVVDGDNQTRRRACLDNAVFRDAQSNGRYFTSLSRSHDVESGDAEHLQHDRSINYSLAIGIRARSASSVLDPPWRPSAFGTKFIRFLVDRLLADCLQRHFHPSHLLYSTWRLYYIIFHFSALVLYTFLHCAAQPSLSRLPAQTHDSSSWLPAMTLTLNVSSHRRKALMEANHRQCQLVCH